jgi:hypothetical protein
MSSSLQLPCHYTNIGQSPLCLEMAFSFAHTAAGCNNATQHNALSASPHSKSCVFLQRYSSTVRFLIMYYIIIIIVIMSSSTVLVRTLAASLPLSLSHTHTSFVILLRHAVWLLWTSDQQRPLPTQDNTAYKHKRQTSMPSAGFEPTILATKRPQTYA